MQRPAAPAAFRAPGRRGDTTADRKLDSNCGPGFALQRLVINRDRKLFSFIESCRDRGPNVVARHVLFGLQARGDFGLELLALGITKVGAGRANHALIVFGRAPAHATFPAT